MAYVHAKEKGSVFITLALFCKEDGVWIDMLREKSLKTGLSVLCWLDIPLPPEPYKFFTSLKMHQYRCIYENNVLDMGATE